MTPPFRRFAIEPGGKKPLHKGWQAAAAPDAEIPPGCNIGIATGDGLLVVDVDVKKGKNGNASLLALELEGFDLPDTFEVATPSGGRHLYFSVAVPVRQGVDVLGPGVDVRSDGGYVLAAGSAIGGVPYRVARDLPVAPAPEWLVARCGQRLRRRDRRSAAPAAGVEASRAHARAIRYLTDDAPLAVEGQGGDLTTYKVACRLKDMGLDADTAHSLMVEHWNERCSPPWSLEALDEKVYNAYAYGIDPPGAAAPEADFQPLPVEPEKEGNEALHPFDELNKHYAFCLAGGGAHILWETTDEHGRFRLEHLAMSAFHQAHAAKKLQLGKRAAPLTEEWMEWSGRRSYDGLVFAPGLGAPDRFYNLWRGFAVEPWPDNVPPPKEAEYALHAWLDHAHRNVCRGDDLLFRWLVAYFAHLVQRPWEKPLVALVFRGGKGVGKNALVERVGDLLGGHFLLTSNRRYLIGNFNGHLENCLLFALDEAFWSGDKQAEGTIKDLITGKNHVIEHKGKEPYSVDNRTRVAIIGNENWLVPASHDERRFAVFDVGEGRKQDRNFFQTMREGMARGGDRLLLRHLLSVSLAGLDLNEAPATAALHDQKLETLEAMHQWWLACLTEGRLVACDFAEEWPREVPCERVRGALKRYVQERQVRSRLPDDRAFGRQLKLACPSSGHRKTRGAGYVYDLPPLPVARAEWDAFIGHKGTWE